MRRILWVLALRDKSNVSLVYSFKIGSSPVEIITKFKDIILDDIPIFLIEEDRETIRSRCIVSIHIKDRLFDLFVREWGSKDERSF